MLIDAAAWEPEEAGTEGVATATEIDDASCLDPSHWGTACERLVSERRTADAARNEGSIFEVFCKKAVDAEEDRGVPE